MTTTAKTASQITNFVAYYRVSTQKQGVSGLGLDSQKATVRGFVGSSPIVAEFTEIESGKKDSRPKLQEAIAEAKRTGSRLVIAKLDRLSRNAAFIFELRDSSVDFVCCDMPDANGLTVGIFAVLAQHERETISSRTKAALQAKKAQGFKLGTPANLTPEARAKGLASHIQATKDNKANRQATNLARRCKESGMTLQAIADELNENKYKTRNGAEFQRVTVKRLLDRAS